MSGLKSGILSVIGEQRARTAGLDADRRLADAGKAEAEATDIMAAATQARADANMASRQLALVSRAIEDEKLALVVDDGARGVSMNENAMDQGERDAYRARWSDLIRSIARAAALALAKAREMVASAAKEACERLEEAAAKIRSDQSRVKADVADLNRREVQLEVKARSLRSHLAAAEDFSKAWEAIPPEQRTPAVNATIQRAGRLAAVAATLQPAQVVRSKGVPDHSDPYPPDPHGRDDSGRST